MNELLPAIFGLAGVFIGAILSGLITLVATNRTISNNRVLAEREYMISLANRLLDLLEKHVEVLEAYTSYTATIRVKYSLEREQFEEFITGGKSPTDAGIKMDDWLEYLSLNNAWGLNITRFRSVILATGNEKLIQEMWDILGKEGQTKNLVLQNLAAFEMLILSKIKDIAVMVSQNEK